MEIKISMPYSFTAQDLSQFTGNPNGEIDGCRISAANPEVEVADAWFVIEDLTPNDLSCVVPTNQLHFLSAETAWGPDKYLTKHKVSFLRQFSQIHTFHDVNHRSKHFAPPFLPWMINANLQTVFRPHFRDLNYFTDLHSLPKTKPLSMFCSDQTWRPEHRRRLEFAKVASKHFGDDLVWFGSGINRVDEKWEGLASFERTIVLENTTQLGVFSEKILDPFLALCEPIYAGSSDIAKNFPLGSNQILDLSDFESSIKRIADIIRTPVSDKQFEQIVLGKNLVLQQHHFLRRICNIAKENAVRNRGLRRAQKHSLRQSESFKVGR